MTVESNNKNRDLKTQILVGLAWTALFIGILGLIAGIVMFTQGENLVTSNPIKPDKVGQFGDLIGGLVGSLWALAGVLFFYVALKEQRNDFKTNHKVLEAQQKALEQQIEEFKLQKEEMEQTREVFKLQSETLKQQQFESTFFNMLSSHQKIKESIYGKLPANDRHKNKGFYKGDGYLEGLRVEMRKIFYALRFNEFIQYNNKTDQEKAKKVRQLNEQTQPPLNAQKILDALEVYEIKKEEREKYSTSNDDIFKGQLIYSILYRKHVKSVSHYFRYTYNILKFCHEYWNTSENDINYLITKKYLKIFQSQLSSNELILIYYNSLSFSKMKELIALYNFLDDLTIDFLLSKSHVNTSDIKMREKIDLL